MKVIANRPLRGDYGTMVPGKPYEIKDSIASDLKHRGLVKDADPIVVDPEEIIISCRCGSIGHLLIPRTETN